MQCDEVIWKTIAHHFCSFKVETETQNFCRNEFNITGLCSKQTCPLANSRYATVRQVGDKIVLFVKEIERSHLPKRMWEKTVLSTNYEESIKQLDEKLEYFPELIIHRVKQRLTKLLELKKRELTMKKLNLTGVKKKIERRESRREQKALKQVDLEKLVEKELLQRLKKGLYDHIYNDDEKNFNTMLDEVEQELDQEDEDYEYEMEEEMEMSNIFNRFRFSRNGE